MVAAAPAGAQLLHLPPTGAGMLPGIGYGLVNVGDDGPYVLASMRAGKGDNAPAAPGLEGLGTQDLLLVVRDTLGVPAFRELYAQKAVVPHLTIRTYNRTLSLTNVTVLSIADGPRAVTSPVPIANVVIHYQLISSTNISLPTPPPPTATPSALPTTAH